MTKALIEKLEKERLMVELFTGKTPFEHGVINGIKVAIDIAKQHSDWVSVSERLPENLFVLICDDSGIVTEAMFSKDTQNFYKDLIFGVTQLDDVKFWQPLPQPPSEVQP